MQKFYTEKEIYGVNSQGAPVTRLTPSDAGLYVYLASDVDAREAQGTAVIQAQRERIAELQQAAKAVCAYDWSDNDEDAVRAIEKLRVLLGN